MKLLNQTVKDNFYITKRIIVDVTDVPLGRLFLANAPIKITKDKVFMPLIEVKESVFV